MPLCSSPRTVETSKCNSRTTQGVFYARWKLCRERFVTFIAILSIPPFPNLKGFKSEASNHKFFGFKTMRRHLYCMQGFHLSFRASASSVMIDSACVERIDENAMGKVSAEKSRASTAQTDSDLYLALFGRRWTTSPYYFHRNWKKSFEFRLKNQQDCVPWWELRRTPEYACHLPEETGES